MHGYLSGSSGRADETRYHVLRLLHGNPELTQRDIAQELDVSLGTVNYCIKALITKGWLKVINFKNSHNKAAYMYLLTPSGVRQKGKLTLTFLRLKVREYEALRAEIRQMRREVGREAIGE